MSTNRIARPLCAVLAGVALPLMALQPTRLASAETPQHPAALAPLLALPKAVTAQSQPTTLPANPLPDDGIVFIRGTVEGTAEVGDAQLVVQVLVGDQLAAQAPVGVDGSFEVAPLLRGGYTLRVAVLDGEAVPLAAQSVNVVQGNSQHEQVHLVLDVDLMRQRQTQSPPTAQTESRAPQAPQANGTIQGTITAADTGLPIQYVTVRAYKGADTFSSDSDFTDSSGNYSLSVAPGQYTLSFVDDNFNRRYAPEWHSNALNRASATSLSVTDGGTLAGINAALDVGGAITGVVTLNGQNDFTPVYVYTSTTVAADDYLFSQSASSGGRYVLSGLQAGNYYLRFGNPNDSDYLTEYYNNQASLSTATPIAVSLGVTTTDINADLSLGGVITGKVTQASSGEAYQNVVVYVYEPASGINDEVKSVSSLASNGTYRIGGLKSGNYQVRFDPYGSVPGGVLLEEWYDNQHARATANLVSVTDGVTTTNINAALERAGRIVGRVFAADTNAPLQGVSPRVYTSTTGQVAEFGSSSDVNGYYTVTNLTAGNYYLGFDAPFNALYLDEFHNDKQTLANADAIAVTLNTDTTVDATLTKGGIIRGRVTLAETGAPYDDVSVYVYTTTNLLRSPIKTAFPDAQGNYTLTQLLAGSYYVEFDPFGDTYLNEWHANTYTRTLATAINVALGAEVNNVDAALDRGASITGRVTGADTGAGLPEVEVDVYGPSEDGVDVCGNVFTTSFLKSVRTDANGYYTVTNLRPVVVRVEFDVPSFGTSVSRNYLDQNYPSPVSLIVATNTPNINAALQRGGTVKGRVVADGSNAPIADVDVQLFQVSTSASGGTIFNFASNASALTDASGYYTITGVPPNTYAVDFDTYYRAAQAYIREFYNNKPPYANNADRITVAAGATVNDINASLALGGSIKGRITDAVTGLPIRSMSLHARPQSVTNVAFASWQYASTDATGNYTITGLTTGNYTVSIGTGYVSEFSSQPYAYEFYNNKALMSQASAVAVTQGSTTSNIDAALDVGARINGVVLAQDTRTPLPTYEDAIDSEGMAHRYTFSRNNGQYSLTGLPTGGYKVWFEGVSRTVNCVTVRYLETYYAQRATRAAADMVGVQAPFAVNNINAALPLSGTAHQPLPNLGVIGGQVVNTASQPLGNINVTVYKPAGSGFASVALGSTGADGRYAITGLLDGNYRVRFEDPAGQWQEEYNGDAVTIEAAPNVSVTVGATAAVNATLNKAVPPLISITSESGTANVDTRTGQVTVSMARGQRRTITVTRELRCPDGSPVVSPTLSLVLNGSVVFSVVMQPIGNNQYQAAVPADQVQNGAQIVTTINCGTPIVVVVGQITLYDPSGIVSDAVTNAPIKDATVTLYYVPDWDALTGPDDIDSTACESNLSKPAGQAWSQPAPTELGGIIAPSSGLISPTINPQKTSGIGYYGWDVAAGCWYVVVSAPGYQTKISPVVGVPPAVLDLNIKLSKANPKVYLPFIRKS